MDISYNTHEKKYVLGNTPYSKKEFISYIESDMLESALLEESGSIRIDVVNDDTEPDSMENVHCGSNILLYGVPGSGKSWTIEHEYCDVNSKVERIVFHPDYTNADFVGQILPVSENNQISYQFIPGPFTKILKDATDNPKTKHILIIEEINRGNAPAIFGEVFQLLDRYVESDFQAKDARIGFSRYEITNPNIAKIVYGDPDHRIRIPSNMCIIGTMNTSDQNVFTLDTAFQRRWEMRHIENNFENVNPLLANAVILDTSITWKNFCTGINKIIASNSADMISSEDKRLGAYFIHLQDLKFDDRMGDLQDGEYDALKKKEICGDLRNNEKNRLKEIYNAINQNRRFPEKVIKYLWDDVFKFNREIIFRTSDYNCLDEIIHHFMYSQGNERMSIFNEYVVTTLIHPDD